MLIVIEGSDGAGKTTLVPKLKEKIERINSDKKVSIYRFPSETMLGHAVRRHLKRELLVIEPSKAWFSIRDAPEDQLFFHCVATADRYAHVDDINNKLSKGEVVIIERWWQSGYVYGSAFSLDEKMLLRSLSQLPNADVNILLDVEPDIARQRQSPGHEDEYEKRTWLRERTCKKYIELWNERQHKSPGRWPILNANASAEEVFIMAWAELVTTAQKSWGIVATR